MANYQPMTGVITMIENFGLDYGERAGCDKIMSMTSAGGGPVNWIVTPMTYFVNHTVIAAGDTVTGFYDADAPVPLIYPPQLQAVVMARAEAGQNVKVDYFNDQLVSRDGMLKLIITPQTPIQLENDQPFVGYPGGRYLIVIYGASTRSIPAQTTPDKIIVMCP